MLSARAPVITGLGIVSAAGFGVEEVWGVVQAGGSGLKPLTLFASPRHGQIPAGEIQRDLVAAGAPRRSSRSDKLGWLAAREALAQAGLAQAAPNERAGVILGASVGGSYDSELFLEQLIKAGRLRPMAARYHACSTTVDLLANRLGWLGPSMAIATACSSSALAIAQAAEMLASGEADLMLAGGTDSLSRMTWGGFHSLLLVDAAGCRPFDAARGGMSLGEGAAVLVLETEESAARRGAVPLARLSGWGLSCDAYHATAPHPQGAGAAAAMQSALRRAGLAPGAIDYVNAHGTGTRDNDVAEAIALKTVFHNRVPPFSSTKRIFGHALAASGALEAVVCVEALRRGQLPPNPGFGKCDPAIGLEPVARARPAALTHVMSNSFGFGGNNGVLIFSRVEAAVAGRGTPPRRMVVAGLGVIGPGRVVSREITAPLPAGRVAARDCGPLTEAAAGLSPGQRRRLSRMQQMALIAARLSQAAGVTPPTERLAVVLGTGLGCMEDASAFIENLIRKDEREPMPSRFPNSVHNAPAGQVAMDQGARGMNAAPTMGEITFECALWLALRQLAAGEADRALAGAVDELDKYLLCIGRRWGLWTTEVLAGEGAVVVSLAPAEQVAQPLGRVSAVRLGRCREPFDAGLEADWIAGTVDLNRVDWLLSGQGGYARMEDRYEAVWRALAARTGGRLRHETYRRECGEFHSASGHGFALALRRARETGRGVLLLTLALHGAKALCWVEP